MTRERVKALLLDGLTDIAIAKELGVTRQAVWLWRKRHALELAPLIAAVEKSIEDYHIAQKVKRIAAKQIRWERGMALIEARAADTRYSAEPGYSTGLMVHKLRSIGSGEFSETVDEYAVDTGLLAAILALEDSAADELGQKPRPDQNINLRAQVLVREYVGLDPKEIG